MTNKDIADRCKRALEDINYKAKDLAAKVDKTGATVSEYLNGSVRIPVTVVATIAEITGEPLDWLIFGKKEQPAAYSTAAIGNSTVNESGHVDLSLVKLIIESVEDHLQSNHLTMTPAKIAELVEVLYEEISESSDKQVNKGTVARLIKLAS